MSMSFFVYVLKNKKGNIYKGQTDNFKERIKQHNDPFFDKRSYTKLRKGPWSLVYKEQFETRQDALMREKQLKSHKGRDWLRKVILGR